MKSIKFKDRLYKQLRSSPPDSPEFHATKTNLRTYNNILRKSIRSAKTIYYNSCFQKFRCDIKNTWSTINSVLNRKKKNTTSPQYIKNGYEIHKDKTDISNQFNDYFINIGKNLSDKIVYDGRKTHKDYLKRNISANFKFKNVNESDIDKIINKLSNKTSCGHDNISTKLLKSMKHHLVKPLTIIINQMLRTGIFPNKFEIAKVIPLYKNKDDTHITNYRPISILPSISKIFEKVIYIQLYDYFTDNDLFSHSQYGFRSNHSTELAVLEVIDRIILDMDKGKLPVNIYLDLSKAFDTLDFNILLDKLRHYGIKGNENKRFENYLQNRQQFVVWDSSTSDLKTIKTGVPQGSVLGPLLFLIYLNDTSNASELFNFISYADDSTLSGSLSLIDTQ